MKKILLFSFFVLIIELICSQSAFAARTITTSHPYYQQPWQYDNRYYRREYNNPNFSDISALEDYALSKTYPRENILHRIQRLETQAFGAIQEGDINYRYENLKNAILSRPKQNYRTSIMRNIGDYFVGQMTGFTPQIQSYNNYDSAFSTFPSSFGNSYETGYSNPWRSRYRINNYNTGSSAGIRILD